MKRMLVEFWIFRVERWTPSRSAPLSWRQLRVGRFWRKPAFLLKSICDTSVAHLSKRQTDIL